MGKSSRDVERLSMSQIMADLTILICCYNAEKYLKECLDSVTGQTASLESYKILFVNDASTDNSVNIAKECLKGSPGSGILDNKKNIGLVGSCNKALNIIETPYFMRVDADDYLSLDAVSNALKELHISKTKDFIIFNRYDVLGSEIKKIRVSEDIYTWIAAGTVFKTNAVKKVGGYSREYWEEYDLYLKLLDRGCTYKFADDYIYYYHRRRESITMSREDNIHGFESLFKKWKPDILNKYGNIDRMMKYYEHNKQ